MNRHWRGIRFITSNSSSTNWDPSLSLQLNHPALVLLEKCTTKLHFRQILGQIMRANLIGQTFPMSRLLFFSAISHPQNLDTAILLFNHFTPHSNLYIYNTMISALSVFNNAESFALYHSMLHSCVYPDKHTLLYLLQASRCLLELKQVHCHAIVMGLSSYGYLHNSVVKLYLDKGQMGLARQVFMKMPVPDTVSFNIMIVGYAKNGYSLEALELFREMIGAFDLKPDDFTMMGLLVSCGRLGQVLLGKSVHAWMERRGKISSLNLILGNALLDMYVKCKALDLAQQIFDALVEKDVISWNTMIAGYAKVGDMELAHEFFDKLPQRVLVSWNSLIAGYAQKHDYTMVRNLIGCMVEAKVRADNVTMVSLLSAAAEIGALDQGKWMHGWLIRLHMKMDAFLGSALIDMYCKCGSIESALLVFKRVTNRDVTVWTTMITGFASYGYGSKALDLFSDMQNVLTPNKVTFVAVLTACSHAGLVDHGLKMFNYMKENYGIQPGVEHYGCLVDLLGRAGRLAEAQNVIQKMPMKPTESIWGAMLSACRKHGNMEMAEVALENLLKLEPDKEGGYVLLSNIYAACGRWSYSDKIRKIMESTGVKKAAGCSSVVVNGVVHGFVAADKRHPRWLEICSILNCLKSEMKLRADFPLDMLHQLRDVC